MQSVKRHLTAGLLLLGAGMAQAAPTTDLPPAPPIPESAMQQHIQQMVEEDYAWEVKKRDVANELELERMKSTIDLGKKRQHHCYFDSCRSLVVLADGLSYVCPSLLHPEMMLGRVEEQHFADGLRDRMVRACSLVTRPQECVACPDLWLCGGPCLAHYLAGRNLSIECSVKRAFMRHARNVVNDA